MVDFFFIVDSAPSHYWVCSVESCLIWLFKWVPKPIFVQKNIQFVPNISSSGDINVMYPSIPVDIFRFIFKQKLWILLFFSSKTYAVGTH